MSTKKKGGTKTPAKGKNPTAGIKNVSTTFTDSTSMTRVDGNEIARNVATFGRMWHVNTDIRRCIEEKQNTAMKSGYELHRTNKTNANERVAQDDAFITALNYFQSVHDMKDDIIMNWDLFGDVYIRIRYNGFKNVKDYKGNKILGYEVLDTRKVKIVTDSNLKPLRYIYERETSGTYRVETYPAEEVRHYRKGRNFDNPLFGLTIMETLVLDVMGDDEANLVNYFWFKNDALPSALYVLDKNLSEEEAKKVVESIKLKLAGGHNKGKEIISNGVEKVEPIAQKHNDADFLNQRKFTTEKVCVAFGVPRTILGYIEDVNHSNGDSQYKKFIENTIRPLERKLAEIFTDLSKDFSGFTFVINDEHIDMIEQRSKIAKENISIGLWTINEGRAYVGDYEKSQNELCDQHIIPSNMQLIDNLLIGEPTQTPPEQLPVAV